MLFGKRVIVHSIQQINIHNVSVMRFYLLYTLKRYASDNTTLCASVNVHICTNGVNFSGFRMNTIPLGDSRTSYLLISYDQY